MASTPSFALLGPLEARVDGALVDLGGVRARSVLAALLLDANHVVTVDRLIEAAWGADAPATARAQVQNRLSVLRRTFALSDAQFIERVGSGYVARLRDDQLDLSQFSIQVTQADLLAAHGDLDGAHAAITAALALWRGPALDGLGTPHLEAIAHRLEERRLHAVESRIEIDLARGFHTAVAAELAELVRIHPYRERLHAFLMLALYRDGRQAESLEAYRRARAGLTEHLGIERRRTSATTRITGSVTTFASCGMGTGWSRWLSRATTRPLCASRSICRTGPSPRRHNDCSGCSGSFREPTSPRWPLERSPPRRRPTPAACWSVSPTPISSTSPHRAGSPSTTCSACTRATSPAAPTATPTAPRRCAGCSTATWVVSTRPRGCCTPNGSGYRCHRR